MPIKEDAPLDKAVASLDKDATAAIVAVPLLTKAASFLDDFERTSIVDGPG
jgi:hypothetical protein